MVKGEFWSHKWVEGILTKREVGDCQINAGEYSHPWRWLLTHPWENLHPSGSGWSLQ